MSINDNLYGQTYQQIMANVAGNNPNFQLITPMVPWTWPTAPAGQISARAYQFVNQIPQWSALGSFSPTGRTVFDAYRNLLAFVNQSLSPDMQKRASDAHDQLIQAQNQYSTDLTSRNVAWTTMLNNTPPGVPAPDFISWATSSGWTSTLAGDEVAIAKALQTYTTIVGQENKAYAAVVAAATAPGSITTKQAGWTVMNQGDGNMVSVPNWLIGATGQDWIAQLSQGTNPVTISLDASKATYDMSSSWAGGDAGFSDGFFGIYASGSWQEMSLAQTDASVKVDIKLEASMTVPVTPDEGWYENSYLKILAERTDSFYPPYTPTGGTSPIFGQGGMLPLVITELVVAYQPSFTITMGSDAFNHYHEQYQASGGVQIGPFSFGGGGGHTTDNWSADSASNTFTGSSTATYPFILGVVVAKPGLD